MKVPVLLILFILVLSFSDGAAQRLEKQIRHREQLWVGYFNQARLTNRFGVWFDVHYRRTDHFIDRPFQSLTRAALTYFIKDNLRIHVGYAFAKHFPAKGLTSIRTEHRPWQQIWWRQKYSGLITLQSLRLEQRFNKKIADDVLQTGYNYNFRARYSFSFSLPLKGKEMTTHTPFLTLGNEIFLNFGSRVIYNTFDQNRLFAGFGYQFSPHLNAQLGYMNTYHQEASGNNYLLTHTVRLFVFHSFDLRDKNLSKQQ